MPLGSMFPGAEALQGSVHVGGTHATSHRRETSQVHGEMERGLCKAWAKLWCLASGKAQGRVQAGLSWSMVLRGICGGENEVGWTGWSGAW